MNSRKRNILLVAVSGIVLIIVISILGAIYIDLSPVFTLVLYAGLIAVTMVYAYYSMETAEAARHQADASVKMARETKDARFAALKPIVTIDWTSGQRGRAITPYFENIGLGPALNVKCYCTHTKFEFNGKQDRTTLKVGKREHITLLTEAFDFEDWAGFAIKCDYQSIYGENFRSTPRFKTEQDRILELIKLNSGDRND